MSTIALLLSVVIAGPALTGCIVINRRLTRVSRILSETAQLAASIGPVKDGEV